MIDKLVIASHCISNSALFKSSWFTRYAINTFECTHNNV